MHDSKKTFRLPGLEECGCGGSLSIAVIKPHGKKQPEEVYFVLQLLGHSLQLKEAKSGTRGMNLKAGTKAETMKEGCLLTSLLQ